MTKLQNLIKQRQEAKRAMFVTRPLRGYLGNQYEQYKIKWSRIRLEIEKLKKH